MAFFGILLTFALAVGIFGFVLFISLAPIIIGTLIVRKTMRKKLGVALRIYGYRLYPRLGTFNLGFCQYIKALGLIDKWYLSCKNTVCVLPTVFFCRYILYVYLSGLHILDEYI